MHVCIIYMCMDRCMYIYICVYVSVSLSIVIKASTLLVFSSENPLSAFLRVTPLGTWKPSKLTI